MSWVRSVLGPKCLDTTQNTSIQRHVSRVFYFESERSAAMVTVACGLVTRSAARTAREVIALRRPLCLACVQRRRAPNQGVPYTKDLGSKNKYYTDTNIRTIIGEFGEFGTIIRQNHAIQQHRISNSAIYIKDREVRVLNKSSRPETISISSLNSTSQGVNIQQQCTTVYRAFERCLFPNTGASANNQENSDTVKCGGSCSLHLNFTSIIAIFKAYAHACSEQRTNTTNFRHWRCKNCGTNYYIE